MTPDLNLENLMTKVAKGDQGAFRLLSRAISQKAFGACYRLLNNDRAAAEDALQVVLIKLWQTAPKWESRGSVMGYVSRLAYTTCMDMHRQKIITTEVPESMAVQETATVRIFEKEKRKILMGMLEKLPERQRDAILMTYFQEQKRSDVAKALSTTEKAVEHLVARGLKTLSNLSPANLKDLLEDNHGYQKTS